MRTVLFFLVVILFATYALTTVRVLDDYVGCWWRSRWHDLGTIVDDVICCDNATWALCDDSVLPCKCKNGLSELPPCNGCWLDGHLYSCGAVVNSEVCCYYGWRVCGGPNGPCRC